MIEKLRILLIAVCCLILTFAAQPKSFAQGDKTYTIGLSVWTGYPANIKGFKEAMAIGGFIEGKNVHYLYGKSGASKEKQRQIAESFKAAGVDLVYTLTTPGTSIIKEVLPEQTPIVFSIVTYPADSGLIESFDYSGNNLVGTSNYVSIGQYVKLLKTILPDAKSVAVFHRKGEPNSKIQATSIIRLMKKANIQVIDREPSSVEEVRQMALALAGEASVFMTTTDTLLQGGGEDALIEVSLDRKIPILSSNKAGIMSGSTFGPVVDFYELGKLSGEMAVKILRDGVSPEDLESKLQDPPLILINRASVERLGINIPEEKLKSFRYAE